jgi:hypothetical protein
MDPKTSHCFPRDGNSRLLWACLGAVACSFGFSQVYTVTRFAGLPSGGYADEAGALARFSIPGDVATYRQGNIFVADGSLVRKLSLLEIYTLP